MFIAEGFEEIEALCPLDIMRRAGLDVTTVGIGSRQITGAHKICVQTDITDSEYEKLSEHSADMIFLPGGMPGTLNLANSRIVRDAIRLAQKEDKYIAAICAAPSILGDMGILEGKEAICYPGFEEHLLGAKLSVQKVVLDGRILTAAGMGVAVDMGLAIVEIFCGREKMLSLKKAIIAE